MATNFDDAILSSNGFIPTKTDTPSDRRTRIESICEAPNIPNPFVGMIFYVSSEDKYYRVKSLKSKVIGGITVQNAQVNEYVPFETGMSGTSNYSELSNKPSIGGVTLEGNKTLDQLGIPSKQSVAGKQDAISQVNVSVDDATGTPSGSASVSGSTLSISLKNIKGEPGETGPANTITIGTVTPSDSTDEASAVMRGEAPNQVLDLVLPRGRQGNSGVTGDTSDIVVVNDLNGGESVEGAIKVLAAEQGKVLKKTIDDVELSSSINSEILDIVKTAESLKQSEYVNGYIDSSGDIIQSDTRVVRKFYLSGYNRVKITHFGTDSSNQYKYAFYNNETISNENLIQLGPQLIGYYEEEIDVPENSVVLAVTDTVSMDTAYISSIKYSSKTIESLKNEEGDFIKHNKYLNGISDAVVKRKTSEGEKTLTGSEKTNAISLFDSIIDKVESVNYDGYLTIGLISFHKTQMFISFYYYSDSNTKYEQSSFNINTKHNVQVKYSDIIDGYIYDNQLYSARGVRIRINEKYKQIVDSLSSGDEFSYDARNCVYINHQEDGFKPEDITNKVFNNSYSKMVVYNSAKDLFAVNESIVDIDFPDAYVYSPIQFTTVSNMINIVIGGCKRNDENLYDSTLYETIRIQYIANIEDDTFTKITKVPLLNSYNVNVGYITVDFRKLYAGINLVSSSYDKTDASIVPCEFYEKAYPYYLFTGFFNKTAQMEKNSGYQTCVVPLNSECTIAEIQGVFDKNANILLANRNGTPQKWCILNENGERYDGDAVINRVRIDVHGYKYLVVSSKGDTSGIIIRIKGYDVAKSSDSYNDYRFVDKGKNHSIHLFNAINNNGKFYTSSERSLNDNYYINVEEIATTFTNEGNTYTSNCLLEIGSVTQTKFYYAEAHNNGTAPVFWKEKGGVKSKIIQGGELIPTKEGYKQFTWFEPNSGAGEAQYMFVKELSDGELLIGTKSRSVENPKYYYYIIYRTENNQSVWVPKIVTSNEHYYHDGLGYTMSVVGYPTKNNSISIEKYPLLGDKTLILLSEYANGNPKYWYDKGETVNGLGVSGKVWASIDNGLTFKKIFDFDEKKNGIASDTSDNNWKWCKSYAGRMATHIHASYIDTINGMIWITNGDSSWTDGKNSLYYININELIAWMVNNGNAVDPNNLSPTYVDNEALPPFHEYKMWELYNENNMLQYDNCISERVMFQGYAFFATNNILLIGNDTQRQVIWGIHSDCINRNKSSESDIFLDIVYERDKDSPSTEISTFPQQFFRRNENSPILSLWSGTGIHASWNGIDWVKCSKTGIVGFASYVVKDLDDKYIIVKVGSDAKSYSMVKLLDY